MHFYSKPKRQRRDGWLGEHVFLRPFDAKRSICVYRFPVYTTDPLLHIWTWVAGRYVIKGSSVKTTRNPQVLDTLRFNLKLYLLPDSLTE